MHDASFVQLAKANDDLRDVELDKFLRLSLSFRKHSLQASPSNQWHDKVEAQLALKYVVETAKEWVINLHEYIHLQPGVLNRLGLQ